MRKWVTLTVVAIVALVIGGGVLAYRLTERERLERFHYEREETLLVVANVAQSPLRLFKSKTSLSDAEELSVFENSQIWLPTGEYFVEADQRDQKVFYPITMLGYRSGPDAEGKLSLTIRPAPAESPPSTPQNFDFIASGSFVIGDRRNPRQPHHVWLQGFFINRFELSNAEYRAFLLDPGGYAADANWTESGRLWRVNNPSQASALLKRGDAEYGRFGQDDQPVTGVNWYEANAYCRWLTRTRGRGRWLFSLPTEAEWEKSARGPDSFDYGLGSSVSDEETELYNWKKNPSAEVTVIGLEETRSRFSANRYGLYHMSGNVAEWTATMDRAFNRDSPYKDEDGRNREDTGERRVVRGGSWYSASIATLYLPYRETFQPAVNASYLGFRIVAKPLP